MMVWLALSTRTSPADWLPAGEWREWVEQDADAIIATALDLLLPDGEA